MSYITNYYKTKRGDTDKHNNQYNAVYVISWDRLNNSVGDVFNNYYNFKTKGR